MDRVAKLGGIYLFRGDPDYPSLLAEVESAPAAIIVKGRLELLSRPAIAMVGARNASAAACRFARQLAQGIGAAGAVVVSGLARVSTRRRMMEHSKAARSRWSRAASIFSIRPRMRNGSARSVSEACCCPNSHPGLSRVRGTSRRATGSSPG
jgi:hypothetical protein